MVLGKFDKPEHIVANTLIIIVFFCFIMYLAGHAVGSENLKFAAQIIFGFVISIFLFILISTMIYIGTADLLQRMTKVSAKFRTKNK